MKDNIVFVSYRKDFEIELLTLWRKSLSQAIAVKEDTRPESISEHLEFLRSLNHDLITVALEKNSRKLVGFMRLEGKVVKRSLHSCGTSAARFRLSVHSTGERGE